jgi:type II secretory ATPase GspE/PulE/Tfp pilus assembly ATPase PilB-like protein
VDLKPLAMKQGMISLRRNGCKAVARGRTSVEEMLRNTLND